MKTKDGKEYKSTMVELVAELEKLPKTPTITLMIEEAKRGEYHDYKNEKYVCGKVASASLLVQAASEMVKPGDINHCMAIRQDIIDGEYDEYADEEDEKMLGETLRALLQR